MSVYTDFVAAHDTLTASISTYKNIPRDCDINNLNSRFNMFENTLKPQLSAEYLIFKQMNTKNSTAIERNSAITIYNTDNLKISDIQTAYYNDKAACSG